MGWVGTRGSVGVCDGSSGSDSAVTGSRRGRQICVFGCSKLLAACSQCVCMWDVRGLASVEEAEPCDPSSTQSLQRG